MKDKTEKKSIKKTCKKKPKSNHANLWHLWPMSRDPDYQIEGKYKKITKLNSQSPKIEKQSNIYKKGTNLV